jgi:heat shock protein HtpX
MLHLVSVVLKWNFLFFLRVINFVSRRKEFRADELACLVAGKASMMHGMRKIHEAAMAWPAYWNTEALPLLQSGYLPPLGDGLLRFLAAPAIAEQVARGLERQLKERQTNPYDTHPPLRDRMAAIEKMTAGPEEKREQQALSLLSDPPSAELRWLESVNPQLRKGGLQRVGWDEVGSTVTVPAWEAAVGELAPIVGDSTVEALAETVKDLGAIGARISNPKGMLLAPEQRRQRAGHMLAMALGLVLLEKGWQLEAQPGNFYLYRGSEKVDVFHLLKELADGKLEPAAWKDKCQGLGISGAPLCLRAAEKPTKA